MIPRTFPSEFVTPNGKTQAIVYSLPSVSGLKAWIDYIPVKGVANSNTVVENTYAADGYMLVRNLDAISGMTPFKDYIPVYEDATATKPWSTDVGGYIPMYGLFSIQGLFAAGEQGVWYDPSDYTTLFQDSAGTTPVTAVEQPVGLMLDKSKGLVLGSELVVNGTFATDIAGWTGGGAATKTWDAGRLKGTVSVGSGGSYQDITVVAGKTYSITGVMDVSAVATGSVELSAYDGAAFTTQLANVGKTALGTYSISFVARPTGTTLRIYLFFGASTGTTTGYFDNISVKELPGNHAFQTTSANRPVLSARVNLLTKTEQFDDAVWTKTNATVTANSVASPNGNTTADTLTTNGTAAAQRVSQTHTVVGSLTFSIYVKAGSASYIQLLQDTDANIYANFDVATGFVGTKGSSATSTITSVGNGWYRCTMSATVATANSFMLYITPSASSSYGASYTATVANVYIWGADLRVSNVGVNLPSYQRVNTSTDYDTTGFPLYLKFNGTNSSLATNSINFTATDKMTVWAGVRKLSDAATGTLAELSASYSANNGAFGMFAPNAVGTPSYAFGSRGTVTAIANISSGYASPITNVLSCIGNISGDESILRVNGVQAASSTADQGTGNYGNYPLYIGSRNNASLYFNGQLYSLIVRGAASTSAQITAAETWVNTKTGAY